MKRSRAIIFFGTLTLSIITYIAWCGRSFYLPKKLTFLSDDYPKRLEIKLPLHGAEGEPLPANTPDYIWEMVQSSGQDEP